MRWRAFGNFVENADAIFTSLLGDILVDMTARSTVINYSSGITFTYLSLLSCWSMSPRPIIQWSFAYRIY